MKVSYDPRYNVAYIRLREKTMQVDTVRISDEVNVDISPDGKVCGIELLNANEQLQIARDNGLVLADESTGKTVTLAV